MLVLAMQFSRDSGGACNSLRPKAEAGMLLQSGRENGELEQGGPSKDHDLENAPMHQLGIASIIVEA
jgi:hypothetical protein